jgi:protease IV
MRLASAITLFGLLLAALGCQQPLHVFTNSRVAFDRPVEAEITARLAPAADEGPVVPMPVSGQQDNCRARIALVDVDGLLVNSNIAGPYASGENPVAAFHEKLSAVARDPRVAAVVVRINSPGGGVAASQMMRHELATFRERRGVPIVACLMDVGAGGAYYLATASDVIYAQPGTVTGGIGVIFNVYSLQDTMAQWNIISQAVKAGDNIDLGSPVRGLKEDSRKILQQMANQYHQQFRDDLLATRPNVQRNDMTVFDGRVFTAKQAMDKGLIDRIGSLDEAVEKARHLARCDRASVVMYERKNHPAYSMYATRPQIPLQSQIQLPSVPGLNRSHLPMFLYMWQPEPTLERLGGT